MLFSKVRIADDGTYYVSGQLPADCSAGLREQTASSLASLGAVLEEAGLPLDSVLKVTVFTTQIDQIAEINEAYAEFFSGVKEMPARSAFGITGLVAGALVEVDCFGHVSR